MTDYQKKAAEALASYRVGKKRLAHYQWELAKMMMDGGGK